MDRVFPESFYIQDGISKGNIFGAPILIDEVSDSLTYIGYANISRENLVQASTLLIKKITVSGSITKMYYAYGQWDNRTTLTYIGYNG